MTLAWIVAATFAGGVVSVLAAAVVSLTVLAGAARRLLAFAVGVLLAVALVELLPEAATELGPRDAGIVVLAGLIGFFVIEKAALWRLERSLGHGASPMGNMIVVGDAVHNFVDGVLIAAAFLQDTALGTATALAVIAHEIPQEIGDFAVLLAAGYSRRRALAMNIAAGAAAIAGGVLGYFALKEASGALPFALAVAAASFLYVAVADLVPLLQRQVRPADFALQLALIAGGIALVLPHGH